MVALLPSSVASAFKEGTDSIYHFGLADTIYRYPRSLPRVDRRDAEAALQIVALSLAPAPQAFVLKELTRLRLLTKSRPESEEDLMLLVAAYAEELGRYPADVVRDVCRKAAATERFWPAWAELKPRLDEAVKLRQALYSAITNTIAQS